MRAVHAVAVALVDREAGLAVGGRPDVRQVARLAAARRTPGSGRSLLAPEEPGRHRGHLEGGIRAQQLRQGSDVRHSRSRRRTCRQARARPARPARAPRPAPGPHSVPARARCSTLFTATVVMPSSSATSAARHISTSRRISTERCAAGQVLQGGDERQPQILTGRDDRRPDRPTRRRAARRGRAPATGPRPGRVRQAPSGSAGPPRPAGNGRRLRFSSARRQRWWRSGTARSAPTPGPRTPRRTATPGPGSPAAGLPRRAPSRASGSSRQAAQAGTGRSAGRSPRGDGGSSRASESVARFLRRRRSHRASSVFSPRAPGHMRPSPYRSAPRREVTAAAQSEFRPAPGSVA